MGSKWWIVGGRKVKKEKESEIVLRALLRALGLQSLKLVSRRKIQMGKRVFLFNKSFAMQTMGRDERSRCVKRDLPMKNGGLLKDDSLSIN